ncbi:unnamed protein product [Merluccius merluccius]
MSHVLRDHTVMSDVHEQEMETGRPLKADQVDGSTTSTPDMHGLPCSSQSTTSPSGEGSGLLSLPWEMVTQIASHLPAQCVISVLPKVCQALGNVGEDRNAWRRRAGRLTGSRVRFPVGPREGYDWPKACLEMEDLITCWADQADWEERGDKQGLLDALEGRMREGADPRLDRGEATVGVVEAEPLRAPSPPPALERVPLPSGHYAQVNSVLLIGGEGAVCASGSRDTNVNLWDLRGAWDAAPCALRGPGLTSSHRGWVWCLASQGPLLASGSFDSTIRLWDLGAGGAARGLISTSAPVLCLSCQTDVLLAGTFNKTISLYDTRVAEPLVKSLQLHGKAVMCLAADERYIISGSQDYTVAIYDRRAGKTLKRLRLRSYLLSMCYQDGEVWAGDNKGTIHAFSVRSGVLKPLSQFDVGHTSLVTGIHKSPGSLYTCSSDRTLKVHIPCAPPRTLCTLNYQEGVSGLSVEAGVLAVASGETSVEVWRPRR